jgi:hypothetical protein
LDRGGVGPRREGAAGRGEGEGRGGREGAQRCGQPARRLIRSVGQRDRQARQRPTATVGEVDRLRGGGAPADDGGEGHRGGGDREHRGDIGTADQQRVGVHHGDANGGEVRRPLPAQPAPFPVKAREVVGAQEARVGGIHLGALVGTDEREGAVLPHPRGFDQHRCRSRDANDRPPAHGAECRIGLE